MTTKPIEALQHLIAYALNTQLITAEDCDYTYNKLIHMLGYPSTKQSFVDASYTRTDLESLLKPLLDDAKDKQLYDASSPAALERFAAQIMDVFMPHPSTLQARFEALQKKNPRLATDDFYHRAVHSRYIRTDLNAANEQFESASAYGTLKVTINLGKPEKDPRDIAQEAKQKSTEYPACLLCKEHVGHDGAPNQPPRANHRVIRLTLGDEPFYLQYSPYAYYAEHAIVLHEKHTPMHINRQTYVRLLDFVDAFPHYFIGSNADLPIVGGSMLSHEHYQGGLATFPIETAKPLQTITYKGITYERLHWPISTVKIKGVDRQAVIEAAEALRIFWEKTHIPSLDIVASTGAIRHNAVTLVVRKTGDVYHVYTMLRNNIKTETRPEGRFHVHPSRHGIKKENIGLIEAMGWAILPGRLAEDLKDLATYLKKPTQNLKSSLLRYQDFLHYLNTQSQPKSDHLNWLKQQVGLVFAQVLEDCAVFPQTDAGQQAFQSWMEAYHDTNSF